MPPPFEKLDQEKLRRLKEWFSQSEDEADELYTQDPPAWGDEEDQEEENPSDRNNLYYSGG